MLKIFISLVVLTAVIFLCCYFYFEIYIPAKKDVEEEDKKAKKTSRFRILEETKGTAKRYYIMFCNSKQWYYLDNRDKCASYAPYYRTYDEAIYTIENLQEKNVKLVFDSETPLLEKK